MFGWQVKFAVLFMKLEGEKEMVRKTITVNLAKNEMQRFFFHWAASLEPKQIICKFTKIFNIKYSKASVLEKRSLD